MRPNWRPCSCLCLTSLGSALRGSAGTSRPATLITNRTTGLTDHSVASSWVRTLAGGGRKSRNITASQPWATKIGEYITRWKIFFLSFFPRSFSYIWFYFNVNLCCNKFLKCLSYYYMLNFRIYPLQALGGNRAIHLMIRGLKSHIKVYGRFAAETIRNCVFYLDPNVNLKALSEEARRRAEFEYPPTTNR